MTHDSGQRTYGSEGNVALWLNLQSRVRMYGVRASK